VEPLSKVASHLKNQPAVKGLDKAFEKIIPGPQKTLFQDLLPFPPGNPPGPHGSLLGPNEPYHELFFETNNAAAWNEYSRS